MHGSLDRPGKSDKRFFQRGNIGFLALPVLMAAALIALAILQPAASRWISEAAQAEFVGLYGVPDSSPTQLARPDMEIRTVDAY